jgi:hypothetical protein
MTICAAGCLGFQKPAVALVKIRNVAHVLAALVSISLLQAPGITASDAAALRGQLAEAQAQAQAAVTETAILQQQLDSERAAAADERRQLEAKQQRLEAERRLLEADREAASTAAAERCAAAEAAQRRAEADAEAARMELSSFEAQVPCMWLSAFRSSGDACCDTIEPSAGAAACQH